MVKKTEERKDKKEENRDIFNIWTDSYTAVSKLWEDSYFKLYKPWLESTGDLFEKASELSKDAAPKQYKEFYDEWIKAYQNNFGKFYPIPTLESNRETLKKLLSSAEESNKLYRSWIAELGENSRKTQEILKGEQDPAKYKEVYDTWIKSYEKIYDELLTLPITESTKEIFGNYTGIPDIYSETFVQLSKLWKDTYTKLYTPLTESISKLSEKVAEISKGDASPEAYKEFYNIWLDTYQESFGQYIKSVKSAGPSKEVFENFLKSTEIYLNLYKSWIAGLEKVSEKAKELTKQTSDPEAYKEFHNLWVKTYGKAFDDSFGGTPASPLKEILEPAKNAAKIYVDTFTNMSKIWVNSYSSFTSRV